MNIYKKTPTNRNPAPTPTHVQLALTLYRLGHGCTYPVIAEIFGVSEPRVFKHVCRILVARLYRQAELRSFIENYEFPCVGAWDRFHIYTTTKLTEYYRFKKRYSFSNMGLVSYNKCFLYAAVGAPCSTSRPRNENPNIVSSVNRLKITNWLWE